MQQKIHLAKEINEVNDDDEEEYYSKSMIGGKHKSKLLKFSRHFLLFITLLLIVLASLKLSVDLSHANTASKALDGISLSYNIPFQVSQVVYYSRQLWLIAK